MNIVLSISLDSDDSTVERFTLWGGQKSEHSIYQVSFWQAMAQLRAAIQLASALDFANSKALNKGLHHMFTIIVNHRNRQPSNYKCIREMKSIK